MRDWPPCPPIQRDGGRRSRPGVNPFISALMVARCPATFPGVWPQLLDTLSTSQSVERGTGAFIYLPPSATPAGITHYTLQAKSCAKEGPPLWKPQTTKQAVCCPLREHTAVCCQQPVSRSVFALCKVWRIRNRRVFEREIEPNDLRKTRKFEI